ncbi:MAG TPA: hypothetical protein VFQ42_22245 [Mycobacterium sp.]|nr:hypothetical protein [Mycobacterium sp.]
MKRLVKIGIVWLAVIYGMTLFFDACHYLGTRRAESAVIERTAS